MFWTVIFVGFAAYLAIALTWHFIHERHQRAAFVANLTPAEHERSRALRMSKATGTSSETYCTISSIRGLRIIQSTWYIPARRAERGGRAGSRDRVGAGKGPCRGRGNSLMRLGGYRPTSKTNPWPAMKSRKAWSKR